jgi:hypothetical protein
MLVLSGEATNTNFIVFGLTRPGHEPTIYSTRGEHANQYATDAVKYWKGIGYVLRLSKFVLKQVDSKRRYSTEPILLTWS